MTDTPPLQEVPADFTSISSRKSAGPRPYDPIECPLNPHPYSEARHSPPEPRPSDFAWQWNGTQRDHLRGPDALREYRPLIISVWMRKGGVGKTSTTLELAHALAKSGKTTMMVDLDTQQDLTEQCFRAVATENKMDDVQDYLETQLPQTSAGAAQTCASLQHALRYVLGISRTSTPPTPPNRNPDGLLAPYPFQVKLRNGEPVRGLFHVQGGLEFDEVEAVIHRKLNSRNSDENINIPGAMFHSIWNAGFKCKADIIILDLSPALGTTTELSVMHSDYFLTPCENNRLSEKNLLALARHIRTWYKIFAHQAPRDRNSIRDYSRGLTPQQIPRRKAHLPLPDIEPKFLGIVLNKYEISKKGIKRDNKGDPVDVNESFKSRAQQCMAERMLTAAIQVSDVLKEPHPGANGYPGDEGIELSLDQGLFPANAPPGGPRPDEFRHPRKSRFCPQYGILARVRRGAQHFELSTSATGRPFSAIETDAELEKLRIECHSKKAIEREEVAHFGRVFDDLAKFINYLPNPEPYNFVFDPRAGGNLVEPLYNDRREIDVVPGYPEEDGLDYTEVNNKRSARQVPRAWVTDETLDTIGF